MLSISIDALTLLVGWDQVHPACKKTVPLIPRFSYGTRGEGRPRRNWLTLENDH